MKKNIWLTLLCLSAGVTSNVMGDINDDEIAKGVSYLVNVDENPTQDQINTARKYLAKLNAEHRGWIASDLEERLNKAEDRLKQRAQQQQAPVYDQQQAQAAPAAVVNADRQQPFARVKQTKTSSADSRYESAVKKVKSTSLEDLVKDPQFKAILEDYDQDYRSVEGLTDQDLIQVSNKLNAAIAIISGKPSDLNATARQMYDAYKNVQINSGDSDEIAFKEEQDWQEAIRLSLEESNKKEQELQKEEQDLQEAIRLSLEEDNKIVKYARNYLSDKEFGSYMKNLNLDQKKSRKKMTKAAKKVKKEPVWEMEEPGTTKVWNEVAYVMRSFLKQMFPYGNDDDKFTDFMIFVAKKYQNKSKRAQSRAASDFEKIKDFFQGFDDQRSAFEEDLLTIVNKRQLLGMLKKTKKYARSIGSVYLNKNFENLVKLIEKKSIDKLLGENLSRKTKKQIDDLSKTLGLANSREIQEAIQKTRSDPFVFGLDQVKAVLEKWIPGESNKSVDICRKVSENLDKEKSKLEDLVLNAIQASKPIYGAFGLKADKQEILDFLGQRIVNLVDVSTAALKKAEDVDLSAEEMKKRRSDVFAARIAANKKEQDSAAAPAVGVKKGVIGKNVKENPED